MPNYFHDRDVTFLHEDDCLLRVVTSTADGRTYRHRCSLASFETVAWALSEIPLQGDGITLARIAKRERIPFTQVNVALEFLKERGLVDVRHRLCYPTTAAIHLHAMVEFHAIAEGSANAEDSA